MKLTTKQATEAARILMTKISGGSQWSVTTANDCLPQGWELRNAEESDFHPATISNFTEAYRRCARRI
jgi:hypothetical protein